MELFVKNKVLNAVELKARCEILLEGYSKLVNIEGLTAIDMTNQLIMPAVSKDTKELLKTIKLKKELYIDSGYEEQVATKLAELNGRAYQLTKELELNMSLVKRRQGAENIAKAYEKEVLGVMNKLRRVVDEMESMVSRECWPIPTYGELLFGVK